MWLLLSMPQMSLHGQGQTFRDSFSMGGMSQVLDSVNANFALD